MEEALYKVMNWPEVEAIVYSEHDNPHHILGAHKVGSGVLINGFFPGASKAAVVVSGTKEYEMELTDQEGFYSVLIPRKSIPRYTFHVTNGEGTVKAFLDPYMFDPVITALDSKKFEGGIYYDIYEKMGAHVMVLGGTKGIYFCVWAPNAVRVSVVGDFNRWDGRVHPMRRVHNSGIFELFIPGLSEGEIYKYELKLKGETLLLKSDPYGYGYELRPATASVVYNLNEFEWNDSVWMTKRKEIDNHKQSMVIYEVHLDSYKKPEAEGLYYNYRELAPMIADYVKELGYTHIELLPVMEYQRDASLGYETTGYYSVTSRFGTPDDFMYFVNYMHLEGIGVLLDWNAAYFTNDAFALKQYDGTCLYEDADERRGIHAETKTPIFNYGRPEVSNFLISNVIFWADKFHVDGFNVHSLASMLYLDYGRKEGEWAPNIYGQKENLEAIEFLKHLNSIIHKKFKGIVMCACDNSYYKGVTTDLKKGGLGFDYKWDFGWKDDLMEYMKSDPLFRSGKHQKLLDSMTYVYGEHFILPFSHEEFMNNRQTLWQQMPGEDAMKFSNIRLLYGYMMGYPSKKLLFMGQEFATKTQWDGMQSLNWDELEQKEHQMMETYVKDLNRFYKKNPACYELDESEDGFEWISNLDATHSIIVFARKAKTNGQYLLFICNFTPVEHKNYTIGLPIKGKYKEVFNSDKNSYGGSGVINPRIKYTKDEVYNNFYYSLDLSVPPMGISIFEYRKEETKKKKTEPKKKG